MAGLIQFNDRDKPKTSRVIKTAPEDIWLNKMVDNYLTGTMTSPRSGVFHPSTLSNKCDRAVWLIYIGQLLDTEVDPRLNRVFQNGIYLEKRIESWFKDLGILMGREVPVKHKNPEMSGRIDFLIRHKEHAVVPVELKSINAAGFSKLKTAREDHETQLQIYLNIGMYDIGTVFYENKDNQKIKTFLVKRDLKRWDNILTRCFNIQNMATPPDKCTGLFYCACRKIK